MDVDPMFHICRSRLYAVRLGRPDWNPVDWHRDWYMRSHCASSWRLRDRDSLCYGVFPRCMQYLPRYFVHVTHLLT